jgi:hypothetical protein
MSSRQGISDKGLLIRAGREVPEPHRLRTRLASPASAPHFSGGCARRRLFAAPTPRPLSLPRSGDCEEPSPVMLCPRGPCKQCVRHSFWPLLRGVTGVAAFGERTDAGSRPYLRTGMRKLSRCFPAWHDDGARQIGQATSIPVMAQGLRSQTPCVTRPGCEPEDACFWADADRSENLASRFFTHLTVPWPQPSPIDDLAVCIVHSPYTAPCR